MTEVSEQAFQMTPEKEENKEAEPKDEEALYNFSGEKGHWQPKPEAILSMFEKLSQGVVLPLKWKCPGRRLPPKKDDEEANEGPETMEVDDEEEAEENQRTPEKSAFDFDESQSDIGTNLSTRPTPGFHRTPRTEKRVARMDNIMDSLRKQQMQRAAARDARRSRGSPVTGRGRMTSMNSPRQAITGSSPAKSAGDMVTLSPKSLTQEAKSPKPGVLTKPNETADSSMSGAAIGSSVQTESSVPTTAQQPASTTSTDVAPSSGNNKAESETRHEVSVVSSAEPTATTTTPTDPTTTSTSVPSSTITPTTAITDTSMITSNAETTPNPATTSTPPPPQPPPPPTTTTTLSTEATSTLPTTSEPGQTPSNSDTNQTQQTRSTPEAPDSHSQTAPTTSDLVPSPSSNSIIATTTTSTSDTSTTLPTTVSHPPTIELHQKEPQGDESGSMPVNKSSPPPNGSSGKNTGQSKPEVTNAESSMDKDTKADGEKS